MRTRRMLIRWTYPGFLLVVSAGIALTIASCSRETTAPPAVAVQGEPALRQNRAEQLRNEYAWMGDYHSRALAHAAAKLSDKKARRLSTTARCRIAMASFREFHESYRKSGRALAYNDLSSVDGVCDDIGKRDFRVNASLGMSPPHAPGFSMSPAGARFLSRIGSAANGDVSLVTFRSMINQIESQAAGTLNGLEAAAVSGLASVAISSAEYWNANLSSWNGSDLPAIYNLSTVGGGVASIGLAPPLTPRFGLSPRARTMIKADITGALGVLLHEWWMGGFALEKALFRGAAASLIAGLIY